MGEDNQVVPPLFDEASEEWQLDAAASSEWYCHSSFLWLFNKESGSYFRTDTGNLYVENPRQRGCFILVSDKSRNEVDEVGIIDTEKTRVVNAREEYISGEFLTQNIGQGEYEAEARVAATTTFCSNGAGDDESGADLFQFLLSIEQQMHSDGAGVIDDYSTYNKEEKIQDTIFYKNLQKDLLAGSSTIMGSLHGKTECEDRCVTSELLPIDAISNSHAFCFYSAVFDGHSGSVCAEYAVKHLHKNILDVFRQSSETLKRKRERHATRESKRKNVGSGKYSAYVDSLVTGCMKGFQITDNNYLDYAKINELYDGCTACVVLIYGPDDDGSIKIISASAGDSRAVLCRNYKAVALTKDHKPNREDEEKRIKKAGGSVVYINGVWRLLRIDNKTKKYLGLSTSRSLGDLLLKQPKPLVVSTPDINVYKAHLDEDLFVVIGSDGIFDVVSDQEVVNIVAKNIHLTPENAAKAVVECAKERGSEDDKTATVIYLWERKNKLSKSGNCEPMEGNKKSKVIGNHKDDYILNPSYNSIEICNKGNNNEISDTLWKGTTEIEDNSISTLNDMNGIYDLSLQNCVTTKSTTLQVDVKNDDIFMVEEACTQNDVPKKRQKTTEIDQIT